MILTQLFETALRDKEDLQAKRKALQDLSMNKDVDQKAVGQRKLDLEKEAKRRGLAENAERLNIGDPVEITGNVEFNGATGEIVDFGQDNRFVIVNLYNHGKHSFHSSDVSYNDYEEGDDEESDEGFFVAIGSEEDGGFIGMVTKDGGKWVEQKIAGTAPYNWGGSYMGYLSPSDVMTWIQKDYSRNAEVEGPFDSEEEAREYASSQYGLDESDISGLLTANKLNRVFRVTVNIYGKTKKFKVKAQSPRIAQHKVEIHQPGAEIINVEEITEFSEGDISQLEKDIADAPVEPIANMEEAKGLKKRVRIVKGSEAGKTGTIGEVRHGAFKGAPKTYTVDIDDGGSIQLPKEALRLLKDQGVAEGLADEFMAMAKAKGMNPRLRGTPDEERARTDAMLKQRAADRAAAPKPAGPTPEQRADLEAKLKELEAKFDPDFEYSDDHSFWSRQNEIKKHINSIKKQLEQGVAEETEKTATGLRHRARPGVYGGAEREPDPLRTLDKPGTNKIEKALGIKFDREKKYQGGIALKEQSSPVENAILHRIMVAHSDVLAKYGPQAVMDAANDTADFVGDVDEIGTSDVSAWVKQTIQILDSNRQVDEVSKDTLGRYVKLAGVDVADRASSSSYKSGAAGDKYNKADSSRQELNRERGIDRAITRLTR